MNLTDLLNRYKHHPRVTAVMQSVFRDNEPFVQITNLIGSARAATIASLYLNSEHTILVLLEHAEAAAYCYHDLTQQLNSERVHFFPSAYKRSAKHGEQDPANEILRTEVLDKLTTKQHVIIVTSPEALAEKVISPDSLNQKRLEIKVGSRIDRLFTIQVLEEYGFTQVDFVYEPGQFAVRGSLIDLYSYAHELPYRIDFMGDEVESIRTFDIERQLSIEPKTSLSIIPNIHDLNDNNLVSLASFLPRNAILVSQNLKFATDRVNQIYDDNLVKANTNTTKPALKHLQNGEEFSGALMHLQRVEIGVGSLSPKGTVAIDFHQSPQPIFHKNFELVSEHFRRFINEGYEICVCSDSKKQTDRLTSIFEDRGDKITFTPILRTLHEGFIDHDLKLCIFTDHQIFDRFHKFALRSDRARAGKVALTLKELNQFQIGDYVVHIDHGVGKFGGLITREVNGNPQEAIKLVYKEGDTLYVSIHGLHRISKYKGKEGVPPTLHRLGSGAWDKLKERTKAKVKDIARDLIKLYALRKAEKGFQYSPDTYLQQELEASFIYEDTPDQVKATADIKVDMESELPMDRLICGDVGFGKTEVAIRAAFKAVTDSKQVAILVPTTVLALQHYKTFKARLKEFPCNIEYISRAKKSSEVKHILQRLADGNIDILIGTHKLVGKEVKFKDLGLLIIDEEQKFGVSIKEKLKQLKVNVDTLTLTATPIPRTLQFSLMGARDLSIINTPPPNRYPVITELHTFDDELIKEAIQNEMDRNGQVFFINNRVQSIYTLKDRLQKLVPDARIAVAHGQLPPTDLEKTILDFVEYDYDVLLATTVIESGIDIPNANTIIVNGAHHFGLSDLHQLRGRVGRSNRKGYCYLIAPPLHELTEEARRRLQAIETFADLGSGFNIAMQDLDIRGAGNMLGAEQSGFIADLGYETYQKILEEAMNELRNEEFAELFAEESRNTHTSREFVQDCQFESDLELMFSYTYVENVSERMTLYRELDNIKDKSALDQFKSRLIDRFGTLPDEAENLLKVVQLRWLGKQYGFEKIMLKQDKFTGILVGSEDSAYYQSPEFGQLLNYITQFPRKCKLSEKNGKRSIIISPVGTITEAFEILQNIQEMQI